MAKFEDMLKKAEKRTTEIPPYVMEMNGEVYEIPHPDALQMLEFSEVGDDQLLAQLRIIFREAPEAWNALVRELRGKDAAVLQVVVEEMFSFWRKAEVTPGKSEK